MFAREIVVRKRLLDAIPDDRRRFRQTKRLELGYHRLSLAAGFCLVLLRVDRLEHHHERLDPSPRDHRDDIAIEVNDAALPTRFRKTLSQGLDEPKALVADEQLCSLQTAALQVAQEPETEMQITSYGEFAELR